MELIPEETDGKDVKVMAPTKDMLRQMEQEAKPPSGLRNTYQMVRKKGTKTVSQGSAFSSLTTTSFMNMMSSPFKAGTGLLPRDKIIKEFIAQQKEREANVTRIEPEEAKTPAREKSVEQGKSEKARDRVENQSGSHPDESDTSQILQQQQEMKLSSLAVRPAKILNTGSNSLYNFPTKTQGLFDSSRKTEEKKELTTNQILESYKNNNA